MKNKKQYQFGNSNYRKMNVENDNEMWFHLEPGKNDSFLLFVIHPVDVKKLFAVRKMKEVSGKKDMTYSSICYMKYLAQPLVNSVEEFFEKADKTCRNIDEFFKVTIFCDTELLGRPLPENCRIAALDC